MNRIDTNGKNTFNVGDEAYIIESNRSVRKVTVIKISRDFCTLTVAVRQEGPRPPHNVWM